MNITKEISMKTLMDEKQIAGVAGGATVVVIFSLIVL